MRFWFFDEKNKRASGPHLDVFLVRLPGFSPESKVALEGARKSGDWKPAKDIPELQEILAEKFPPVPPAAPAKPGAAAPPPPPKK